MTSRAQTPFPVAGYYGPAYFCDREEELQQLIRNLKGGHSTTLISLRRLGKTSLIRHLYHHLRSNYTTLYIDILPTESLSEFLNRFSSAVASEFPEKSSLGKKLWQMIKSLRPVISYDALSGSPLVSIQASPEEIRKTIEELCSILEDQSKPVVIAIDEFQQIMEYPEKQTDAWLRSLVQRLNNVSFIFSGSQQRLMSELFTSPERPFYRSTRFMKIGKLKKETYRNFIVRQFKKHGRLIADDIAAEILEWTGLHTYYVQLLCNRVFLSAGDTITTGSWKEEAAKILKEQEFVFYGYREMLTKPQWELMKAIAREVRVYQPTSSDFISSHSLGNPATVLRSLKSLSRMELVYRESLPDGASYYGVYDILFGRWVAD